MLTQNQKKQLKSIASTLEVNYQIGKNELSETALDMFDKALEARELIKITVHKTVETSLTELAINLSMALHAEVVQVIGRIIVLYRRNRQKPKIHLVK